MPPETVRSSDLHRPVSRALLALLAAALLAACAAPAGRPAPPAASAGTPAPTLPDTPHLPPPQAMPAEVVPAPAPAAATAPPVERRDPLAAALAYADFLRSLGPAELQAEQAALADPGHPPLRQMQLALLLMQSHQGTDTVRAQALLQRLLAGTSEGATELRPLARLLLARLQDIRRLEEQGERQAQQLREAQRRIEALTDRLEAMRAIERSLSPRPPVPGTRPPAP